MVWSLKNLSEDEIDLILKSLKRYGEDATPLYNKIWCWKMNYRKKDYGLS